VLSAEEIMKAIHEPMVLLQGYFPKNIVTPANVPQSYIDMSEMLGLPRLQKNMTLTKFRACTKLDLLKNMRENTPV
jgi:hypothetical protein